MQPKGNRGKGTSRVCEKRLVDELRGTSWVKKKPDNKGRRGGGYINHRPKPIRKEKKIQRGEEEFQKIAKCRSQK